MLKERDTNQQVSEKLKCMATSLHKWNRIDFGNIFYKKHKLKNRSAGVQHYLEHRQSELLIQLEIKLQLEYETILLQEENF